MGVGMAVVEGLVVVGLAIVGAVRLRRARNGRVRAETDGGDDKVSGGIDYRNRGATFRKIVISNFLCWLLRAALRPR